MSIPIATILIGLEYAAKGLVAAVATYQQIRDALATNEDAAEQIAFWDKEVAQALGEIPQLHKDQQAELDGA